MASGMSDPPVQKKDDQSVVILTTPRLILRTTTESDIPLMQERIFGDKEVMRHAFAGVPMARDEAEGFMRKFFTFRPDLTGIAILTEKHGSKVIGFAGLFPCDALGCDDFEIGFVLVREAWGKGIATEIGEAQLAFGFGQLNCPRLLGLVHPQNAASIHALEKLGMRYVSEVSGSRRAARSVYIIQADEWRQRRRG